jgi:AraC-like DNA-binding protein
LSDLCVHRNLAIYENMSLIIKNSKPSQKLLQFIDMYWHISNPTQQIVREIIVPDGCMDIICKNSELLIVGTMQKPKIVEINPNDNYFGVRFRASVLTSFVGLNATILAENIFLLKDINQLLFDEIKKLRFDFDNIDEINRFFELATFDIKKNELAIKAVDMVYERKGDISVSEIESLININSRRLERIFRKVVGYSPRKFISIVRFFYAYQDVMCSDDSLSLKAVCLGYYDQAHFNKEFKKYAGFVPTDSKMSNFYNTKSSNCPTIHQKGV